MDFPARSSLIVVAAVAASGLASAAIDVRTRRVPNWLTCATAALGLGLAAFHVGGMTVGAAAAGWGVGLLLMLPGYAIAHTGAGDVKLVAAIGTLLGPRLTVVAFVYTAIAGGLVAIVVAVRRRRLRASLQAAARVVSTAGVNTPAAAVADLEHQDRDNGFAYAPAIAIGALAAVLGG